MINKVGLVFIITLVIFISSLVPKYAQAEEPIQIVAGGDVMLDSWIEGVVRTEGWHYPFVHLDSILSDSDLVFANLEAPFGSQDSAYPKTHTFQVSPDLVQVLQAGKIKRLRGMRTSIQHMKYKSTNSINGIVGN